MKKAFAYISIAMMVSLLVVGCGHRSGNNPLGVIGGGEDGYGSLGSVGGGSFNGGGGQHDASLVGTWRWEGTDNNYELLTFTSNGTFVANYYVGGELFLTVNGTYSTSGNTLTFFIEGESGEATYSIVGNTLTITEDGDTTVYTRVS